LLLLTFAISLTAEGGALTTYALTRPEPLPMLRVHLIGEGEGTVLVYKVGDPAPILRCNKFCQIEVEKGTRVRLSAIVGEQATFGGYQQAPMRTPPALVPYLGDPLEHCTVDDAADAAAAGDVRECSFPVIADTTIAAEFGEVPHEVDVAIVDEPKIDDVIKPLVQPKPVAPIDPEKLDEKPLQVALAPVPQIKQQPPPPIPPPPKQQEQQKPPPPPVQPPPNMVMVEVKDDKHVVDKAPDDATKLSDKNRDVDEETRAKETNLEKESEGQQVASRESDDHTSQEIGGPEDKIRQLEQAETPSDKRVKETDHSGDASEAKGEVKGEGGDNGEDGTGTKVLSMRDIGGRGSITDQGKDGKKLGKKGVPGINTPIGFQDYERIMGKEKVDEERQVAARKMSSKKGRYERKLEAIKSSLENFVPDVRPGNQTALKTRAHPYAVYIARMHRRIHELWGFGFLEDLDNKPATYPLNNPDLWVNLEISVNPDGSLHKVTIAKTSGKTEFDVAAVDTVISAAPFEATPEAIRSVDGRIYLRWGFYRNWRQCGTFNVEPYILTEVPDDSGQGVLDDGEMVKNVAHAPGSKRGKLPTGDKPVTPDDGKSKEQVSPSTSVTDKQALFAANLWVSAFATAQVDKLVKYSAVPFYAGGKVAAQSSGDLKEMYEGLIVESGPMKDWKLLTPSEYGTGGAALPEGNLVLQVRTAKATFAIVLTKTKSGDFRATQLAR
jgi:TonB family protein